MKHPARFPPLLLVACAAPYASAAAEVDDYTTKILPILRESCYSCHSDKKQKGKLRLDSPAAILKGGKGGPAVVSGNAAKSPLYALSALPATDDKHMPAKGDPLSKEQLATIKTWIEAGAPMPKDQAAAPATPPTKK